MNEENYSDIYKRLIRRFVISSLLLFSVFIFKQAIIHYQISQEENTSYIVNLAGRQRMLSQKIVKDLALIQLDQVVDEDETYREDLKQSIELWENSHNKLLVLNETEEFEKKDSEVIFQLFEDLEPTFIGMLEETKQLLLNIEENARSERDANIKTILEYETIYLEKMDSIVSRYETESKASVQLIEVTHTFLFLLIIGTLIFIIFEIFIPLITYLKRALWKENESNRNLIKMFQTMRGALFVIKKDGEILFKNQDAGKIIAKEAETNDILYLDTSVKWIEFDIMKLIEKVESEDSRIEDVETTIEVKDGYKRTVLISAITGNYYGNEVIMLNLFDVTAQKQAEEDMKNIAIKDELTGLYNRHFLESMIDKEFERAQRYEIPLSASLLDLDHFKKINDQWGHPVGDSVLKFTADTIENNIRKSDYAIRVGGEEFLILMPNTNSMGAYEISEKVRKAIEASRHPVAGRFTASLGVAERTTEDNYTNLYSRIDEALYHAKEKGRNCVVLGDSQGGEYVAVSAKWNPSWNCGEVQIDKQHKGLYRKISQLVNRSFDEKDKIITLNYIDDIIQHIITHFEYEEYTLVQAGYEEAENHKKIHRQLLERTQEIRNAVEAEKLDALKAFELIQEEVIVGHILSEDMNFFPCFQRIKMF